MTQMTVQQVFELAWRQQQQGRLADAEALYRQILDAYPNHPDAIQMLGVIASRVGRHDLAVDLLRRAISINPTPPIYHCNLGQALAEAARQDEAIAAFAQAIALQPDFLQAIVNQGNSYLAKGMLDQAIANYRRALKLDPNVPETHNNLGNAYRSMGQLDEAIDAYKHAIALRPDLPDAHYNLGTVLKDKKDLPASIKAFQRALAVRPQYPEAMNNLGNVYQALGELKEAESLFRQAIAVRPNFANAYNNLGNAVRDQGNFDEAIACYRSAMSLAPQWPLPHYNYGLTLLLQGNFEQGWIEHEARRRAPEAGIFVQDFPQPTWDGSELNGKTILIHSEQGFGDSIQFVRYVPLVAARGGRVILQCNDELFPLLQNMRGADRVLPRSQPLPEFDLHCPMLSLPLAFKTNSPGAIPAQTPYLDLPVLETQKWRERLSQFKDRMSIGIVWAGRPEHPGDRKRSIPLPAFAPLATIERVQLHSLQKGVAADQLQHTESTGMNIIDWSNELSDFSQTAALIHNLDLVISVDTAPAHLAGALGKPVWVLLPWMPDWRWLMSGETTAWYPSMRLFRQPIPGDYETPIRQLVVALQEHARARRMPESDNG